MSIVCLRKRLLNCFPQENLTDKPRQIGEADTDEMCNFYVMYYTEEEDEANMRNVSFAMKNKLTTFNFGYLLG